MKGDTYPPPDAGSGGRVDVIRSVDSLGGEGAGPQGTVSLQIVPFVRELSSCSEAK